MAHTKYLVCQRHRQGAQQHTSTVATSTYNDIRDAGGVAIGHNSRSVRSASNVICLVVVLK